jgi:O-antigen/teichoic acid export membrane protein
MPDLKQKLAHPILKSALASTGFRQAAFNTFGSIVSSGFAAIATILITRQLGPEKFGLFSTAFALVLILVKLNDAGLSTATSRFLARAEDRAEQEKYLAVVTRLRLFLSAGILFIGLAVSPILSSWLKISTSLIISAIVISLATVYFEHLQFTLQALHQFKTAVKANIIQASFKLGFAILFIVLANLSPLQPSVILIFLAYMFAPGIPVILSPWLIPKSNQPKLSLTDHQPHLTQIKNLMTHSAISLISAGIIENVDILFVKAHLSEFEAGLLGGVSKVALLLYILAYSIGNVLNARVAKYKQKHHLQKYWQKAFLVLGLSLGGLLLSLPLAKPILTLTIGPQYLPGLNIMRIILASGFLTLGVIPFIAFFYTFDLPWYFSLTGIVQLIIVLVGNGLLVPKFGLEAAAWTRFTARLVLLLMTIGLAGWYYQREYQTKTSS